MHLTKKKQLNQSNLFSWFGVISSFNGMDLLGTSGWNIPTFIRSVQSVLFSLFLSLERNLAAALKPCSIKSDVKVNVFNATPYCHPFFKLSLFSFFFFFCHASKGWYHPLWEASIKRTNIKALYLKLLLVVYTFHNTSLYRLHYTCDCFIFGGISVFTYSFTIFALQNPYL